MPRIFRAACSVAIVACASTISAAPTQSELDAYKVGRKLYEDGNHDKSAQYFTLALDGPTPTIKDPVLVAQSRMIRGASDMYLGRIADADAQFERILRANPTFEPDIVLFPPGVLEEYRRIRAKLEKEAADKKAGDANTKKIAALEGENARLAIRVKALEDYASRYDTVTKRSRVLASLPFGYGQFQNGDPGLGIFFASTELIALGTATVSFFYHQSLPINPVDQREAESAATTARLVNWISLGAFTLLAVGGVVQAHIAFVPETKETKKRPLPKNLTSFYPITSPVTGGAVLGIGAAF
jgi:hypothetical protein